MIAESIVTNGLSPGALNELIDVLRAHPESGRVTFLADSTWQDGARVFNSVTGYRIDGQLHHADERKFVVLIDEPVELTGTDAAPGPVEHLMHALGSCMAATISANAALQGVRLTRLEVALESDLDLHGFFGLDEHVRPGIGALRAKITIAGDADANTLRQIARRGYQYSPVRDSVENGVTLRPEIEMA